MKRKRLFICAVLFVSFLICVAWRWPQITELWEKWSRNTSRNNGSVVQLKVYLVAPQSQGDNIYRYTDYALGEFMSIQTAYGEEGYIYKTMLEEYQRENEVELDIEYFDYSDDLDAQLVRDLKNGTLPDLIIENSINYNDAYALLDADILLDLSSYVEEDGLYDNDEYYNEVLRAGQYQGQQMILPLSFNMSTIMSSKESLSQYNIDLSEADLQEMLVQFAGQANRMQQGDAAQELLAQFVSPSGDFPIFMLLAAGGGALVDYEEKTVELDQEFYKYVAEFYKQFARQEMGSLEAVIEQGTQLGLAGSVHDQRMGTAMRFQDLYRTTAAFIEGGSCGNTFIHSFAAQANYYESAYTDVGEEFCLYGIPTYNNGNEYTPMITSYGAVMVDTKHPKEAYDFLKYMMDQPYFMHFDLSVNRSATEQMLNELCNTTYEIIQMRGYFDIPDLELATDYEMKPMSEETEEMIVYLLDHMGEATLNNCPVFWKVQENMLMYVIGECSLEESYQACLVDLHEYLNTFSFEGQMADGFGFDYSE